MATGIPETDVDLPANRSAAIAEVEQAERHLARMARHFQHGGPVADWIDECIEQLRSLAGLLGDADA